jgi:hypothetical protein
LNGLQVNCQAASPANGIEQYMCHSPCSKKALNWNFHQMNYALNLKAILKLENKESKTGWHRKKLSERKCINFYTRL